MADRRQPILQKILSFGPLVGGGLDQHDVRGSPQDGRFDRTVVGERAV
jgi:hypothetical protein